jgi:hypothetical protein
LPRGVRIRIDWCECDRSPGCPLIGSRLIHRSPRKPNAFAPRDGATGDKPPRVPNQHAHTHTEGLIVDEPLRLTRTSAYDAPADFAASSANMHHALILGSPCELVGAANGSTPVARPDTATAAAANDVFLTKSRRVTGM